MKSPLGLAAFIAVAAGYPCAASSNPPTWSLVEAQLVEVKDIAGEPGAPRLCIDDKSSVCLDGSWRLKYSIERTLAGPPMRGSLYENIGSAEPRRNLRYLLVVSNHDGKREIEWRGMMEFGLCLDAEQVRRFGLADAEVRFPCSN